MDSQAEQYQVVQARGCMLFHDYLGAHINSDEIVVAPKSGEPGLSYEEALLLVNQGASNSLEMAGSHLISDC